MRMLVLDTVLVACVQFCLSVVCVVMLSFMWDCQVQKVCGGSEQKAVCCSDM